MNNSVITSDFYCSGTRKVTEVQIKYNSSDFQLHESEIVFDIPVTACMLKSSHPTEIDLDADGDLVIRRKYERHAINIGHCISTPLALVGLQVWTASLFLCDYLIHIHQKLRGKNVFELGAGVGICSMVSSLFAKRVFCTDTGNSVLTLCMRNIIKFEKYFKDYCSMGTIKVKDLNWFQKDTFLNAKDSNFGWTEEEKELTEQVSIFLASDVIYDDDLTNAFMKTVISLMEKPTSSWLLLTLEKRLNFTLDVLDVTSPAYDFFQQRIEDLKSRRNEYFAWNIYRIENDFPQYFHYKRNNQLELWAFECTKL